MAAREIDLLLGCGEIISAATISGLLNEASVASTVLTGAQAGIMTNNDHGNAQIISLDPKRIIELLETGMVVVVTGFQGQNERGDLTTLGRGGSDTTAAALASALRADMVEIYTDVNGVLTADPRIVGNAKPLPSLTYTEIVNMAQHGAKVIHPRAVELARLGNIPIRVRSTFSDEEGTWVTGEQKSEREWVNDRYVTGITHVSNVSQIHIPVRQGQYDLYLRVFKELAKNRISVDFINVNPSNVLFTVFDKDTQQTSAILERMGYDHTHMSNCAKISIIGGGMNGAPGVMAHIVEALTNEDIPILQSADSNMTIWVLVRNEHVERAIRALHDKFALYK